MDRTAERYPTSAFDYALPRELIAQRPAAERDESRLMVVERSADRIRHLTFRDLIELIPAGDALVLNETRVFPARFVGRKPTGAAGEVLLLRPVPGDAFVRRPNREDAEDAKGTQRASAAAPLSDDATPEYWEALVRPGGKLKPGRVLDVADELRIEIVDSTPDGGRIVRLATPLGARTAIERFGRVPLPPYIDREGGPEDAERYQTVYARREGSVAAPTAGLHFTPALLEAIEAKGVRTARIVLHVGVGTFRPVEREDPGEHRMHAEEYAVSGEAAAVLNSVRRAGGAVWAVGTTVARTLETVAGPDGVIRAGEGWTRRFIRPPYRFRAVDRLVTNFHLPCSTLLMLVAAFGGYERIMRAYREAVAERYRFYSYGDAMVIV